MNGRFLDVQLRFKMAGAISIECRLAKLVVDDLATMHVNKVLNESMLQACSRIFFYFSALKVQGFAHVFFDESKASWAAIKRLILIVLIPTHSLSPGLDPSALLHSGIDMCGQMPFQA